MMMKKPNIWRRVNFFSVLLLPLSTITLIFYYLKKIFVKQKEFDIPIVCVGNIYVGGTGKTPLSIYLYNLLKRRRFRPAIIKKYYLSHQDEINLLKDKVKQLFLSSNRCSAILEAKRKKNNIMVLDDGFQDNTVKKKLNILCFNSIDMVGNGFLIPSGPLREPLRNMINSQIVVINGKRNIVFEKKLRSISKQTKIFYSKYIFNKKNIRKENVLAFAGIGNPEGFFNLLKENNFNVKEKFSYPDHYNFQKNEIKELIKRAKKENLKLLTTEKDYFRIKKLGFKGIYYMPVTLKILKSKLFEKEILKNL